MASVTTTRALVMTGRRTSELRELPVPVPESDAGLLRVDAAGVCGADVGFYNRDLSPRILGHENVGTITDLGRSAARRWGVSEGDRVALEEYLPCGHCHFCRSSEFRLCMASDASANPDALRYGSTPLTVAPALWGGFSEYLYLHPNAVLHRVPDGVPPVRASLALPLANGREWAFAEGRTQPGDVVVIFGPGQQGLGCVLAARQAGAGKIIVTGLRRDKGRLDVAKLLGADETICVEDEDAAARIDQATNGEFADLVVDTAAGNEQTVGLALSVTRKRGRVVIPAATMQPLSELDFYKITRKYLTVQGVRGHSYESVDWALALIASEGERLDVMSSLEVGLSDGEQAILGTAGELETAVVHAAVVPSI